MFYFSRCAILVFTTCCKTVWNWSQHLWIQFYIFCSCSVYVCADSPYSPVKGCVIPRSSWSQHILHFGFVAVCKGDVMLYLFIRFQILNVNYYRPDYRVGIIFCCWSSQFLLVIVLHYILQWKNTKMLLSVLVKKNISRTSLALLRTSFAA